jgi:citrate lyase subunit beta/citryl-CoA lyase
MLFAPGNHARRVQKALTESGADAAILDLEDALAIAEKVATRAVVAAALRGHRATRAYVRVNGVETPWFFGDLEGVVGPGLDGILVPKTAHPQMLYLADRYLAHLERERGLAAGSVDVIPIVESAEGVANLREICGSGIARVRRLSFGAADLTADLGFTWTAEEQELLPIRTQLAVYSRWAGLEPPLDTVFVHVRDLEGFEATTRRGRQLGFQGRMCIHPDQVEPANRIYSPTLEEVAWAEEVVAAFAEAEARGEAAIQVRGQMVDYPIARQAEQLLRRAAGVERGG